jgi:hypothetical protein
MRKGETARQSPLLELSTKRAQIRFQSDQIPRPADKKNHSSSGISSTVGALFLESLFVKFQMSKLGSARYCCVSGGYSSVHRLAVKKANCNEFRLGSNTCRKHTQIK